MPTEKLKVIFNREVLGLVMEMLQGTRCVSTRYHPQALILHPLDLGDMRGLEIGFIDRSRVVAHGGRDGFKGELEILLRAPPIRSRHRLQNIHTRAHIIHNRLSMRAEGELWIERNAEDFGRLDERNEVATQKNLGMVGVLVGVRGEKGDARFYRRYRQFFTTCPFFDPPQVSI